MTPSTPCPSPAEAVSNYLAIHSSHWRPKTLLFHQTRLKMFLKHLDSRDILLPQLTARLWSDYVAERRKTVSEANLHHDGQVVRLFLRHCVAEGWLETNPLDTLKLTPMPEAAIEPPSIEEVNRLVQAMYDLHDPDLVKNSHDHQEEYQSFFTARNVALLTGLITTGCRVGELLGLRMKDINLESCTLSFQVTKTHRSRIVPFDPLYLPTLEAYLSIRSDVETEAVFLARNHEVMTYNAFRLVWNRARRHAKLPTITIHSLRHYSLTRLYVGSGDLKSAMQVAGHRSTATAMRYQHRNMSQIREAVSKAKMMEGLETENKKKII